MLNKDSKQVTARELATLTGSQLLGDPDKILTGVADLESAGPDDVSFFANPRYEKAMSASQAGLIFVSSEQLAKNSEGCFLISNEPSAAFQKVLQLFLAGVPKHTAFRGIHPSAVVADDVTLGEKVVIGPNAVIETGATIGDRTVIAPNVTIGEGVRVGMDCIVHPSVTVQSGCEVGNRVVLHPGVVLGSDGYGYTTDATGHHSKLDQLGNVVIEDDVEIGANSTIDRARFKTTLIKRGTKIDNLVQIGHGVELGENNLIIAQVGIAGSTKTGRNVVIAGQSAVIGHITLADGVIIAGKSGVIKGIDKPGVYGGMPAGPLKDQRKQYVHLRNLDKHVKTLKELKQRIQALEEGTAS